MVLQLPGDLLPAVVDLPAAPAAELASWPTSDAYSQAERTCLGFAEQFVIDVAGVRPEDRAALSAVLGSATFGFVQCLYVLDHGTRLLAVVQQLFGVDPLAPAAGQAAVELWPALERMMTAVARLRTVDPLTAELVRLRGARVHHCRLCSSRRRSAAAAVNSEVLDAVEPAAREDLTEAQRAALMLAEAILLEPAKVPPVVVDAVHRHLTPAQGLEIALLVAHNAANKIAVALGADDPTVREGVEYFEVTDAGDYRYGLPAPTVSPPQR
jgi:alkylhydroperoxidase family enzyme